MSFRDPIPPVVRFADLHRAGIIKSWPQLARLIQREAFPTGFKLGPNSRAWLVADIEAWLTNRPTERKPDLNKKRATRTEAEGAQP